MLLQNVSLNSVSFQRKPKKMQKLRNKLIDNNFSPRTKSLFKKISKLSQLELPDIERKLVSLERDSNGTRRYEEYDDGSYVIYDEREKIVRACVVYSKEGRSLNTRIVQMYPNGIVESIEDTNGFSRKYSIHGNLLEEKVDGRTKQWIEYERKKSDKNQYKQDLKTHTYIHYCDFDFDEDDPKQKYELLPVEYSGVHYSKNYYLHCFNGEI